MAYNSANLAVAFGGNGKAGRGFVEMYHGNADHPTIWEYDADADELTDIEAGTLTGGPPVPTGAYFDTTVPFRSGDLLLVTASDGKALYRVESNYTPNSPFLGIIKLATVDSFGSLSTIIGG